MDNAMEQTTEETPSVTAHAYVRHLISENYNEHKSEKNKLLSWAEVQIVCISQEDESTRYFANTGRNDGLLYEVLFVDGSFEKATLFLYNRIARKFIEKEENA